MSFSLDCIIRQVESLYWVSQKMSRFSNRFQQIEDIHWETQGIMWTNYVNCSTFQEFKKLVESDPEISKFVQLYHYQDLTERGKFSEYLEKIVKEIKEID